MEDRYVTDGAKSFFMCVVPAVLSFALSGVYAIADGYFVGNSIGDAGLSAINIAYPIVAVLQAAGTGIGMGAAVKYSVSEAEGRSDESKGYIACAVWMMIILSAVLSAAIYLFSTVLLEALGASDELLVLGNQYVRIIAFGTVMQIFGTGLVPLMRNFGGSFWAMAAMTGGFAANILLDYLFVWVMDKGMQGAAAATVIGQGATMAAALLFCVRHGKFTLKVSPADCTGMIPKIIIIGLAPFGLTLVPNISLVIINKFSAAYGGEEAIAAYACIAYVICIVYLIMQGVGDGSQPLMSRYYGSGDTNALKHTMGLAYAFALCLAVAGSVILYLLRNKIGVLFGASESVNAAVSEIMPVFLISVPFVAVTRIQTAALYATEKSIMSYILTYTEPVFMLVLMLILPPLFGGQDMIWRSTVIARILTACLAVLFAFGNLSKK